MIIVEVNEKLPIERALKVLKKKFDKQKTGKKLREKLQFIKKSVKRREEIKKATYKQKLQENGIS
jgi:small subunit ribosomal protein S21